MNNVKLISELKAPLLKIRRGVGVRSEKAFTLAEVLITLGVIGVVSAITMPTLIQNYQKHVTVNKLKKTYSALYQAIKMSENDNGNMEEWQWANTQSGMTGMEWLEKYILPYIKYTSVETENKDNGTTSETVHLPNGVILTFWNNNSIRVHVSVYLKSIENAKLGKDFFRFFIGMDGTVKELRPYDSGWVDYAYDTDNVRDNWKYHKLYGCCNPDKDEKCSASTPKYYCAGLIMYDGWQIKDDYPW